MKDERYFISYRFLNRDFLLDSVVQTGYGSAVTDVTPALWVMYRTNKSGKEHHILYAERISLALASELVHSGSGIVTDYYKEDE